MKKKKKWKNKIKDKNELKMNEGKEWIKYNCW